MGSLGSMFASPSKQAQAAASNVENETADAAQQALNYQEQIGGQARSAIGGLGDNPYFTAAGTMSPSSMQTDPANATTFGASGPGTTLGTTSQIPPGSFTIPTGTRATQPVATRQPDVAPALASLAAASAAAPTSTMTTPPSGTVTANGTVPGTEPFTRGDDDGYSPRMRTTE